jgi:hypothetical protein
MDKKHDENDFDDDEMTTRPVVAKNKDTKTLVVANLN